MLTHRLSVLFFYIWKIVVGNWKILTWKIFVFVLCGLQYDYCTDNISDLQ